MTGHALLPVAEAQARLLALAAPVESETLPLAQAAGRWAAADIVAGRAQPVLDLSAMDGYAIRFSDLPGPWRVVGEVAAGALFDRALAPGEAARIFTGAPVPAGADTILIQEEAARKPAPAEAGGDRLTLAGEGPSAQGLHIRRAGSNHAQGAVLVAKGERLTPARLALAALGGHSGIAVNRGIRVAIVSTGDELVPLGAPAGAAQIHSSNAVMLAALLAPFPVEVADLGIVADDLDALRHAFARAADADIIVTSGGASVGDHDLVRPALEAAGARIDFWRVAVRPGKPLMAGRLGRTVALGLPGNPVSAHVTATLFLLPLVAALAGAASPFPRPLVARLGADLPANGPRAHYLRAELRDGLVFPLNNQYSASITSLALATALIVRPPDARNARVGEDCEVLLIA